MIVARRLWLNERISMKLRSRLISDGWKIERFAQHGTTNKWLDIWEKKSSSVPVPSIITTLH